MLGNKPSPLIFVLCCLAPTGRELLCLKCLRPLALGSTFQTEVTEVRQGTFKKPLVLLDST